MHSQDDVLSEDYLDWLSLHYFKDVNFWRKIPEEKLIAFLTFEELKEKEFWDNWIKIFGGK